jgi:hypothetical protein
MIILQSDIIAKIRTAIDDIVPEAADSFTDDTDAELWQAAQHAVEGLLQELPIAMLVPRSYYEDITLGNEETSPQATVGTEGIGRIELPSKFLRFVSFRMQGWSWPVYTLVEPGSDEEIRQRSAWGRGTPDKPKAMLTFITDQDGSQNYYAQRVLKFWTAALDDNSQYIKNIQELNYIPMSTVTYPETPEPTPTPSESVEETREVAEVTRDAVSSASSDEEPYIDCALRPEAEKAVIYQAASIFFEGKKEPETAAKFRNI